MKTVFLLAALIAPSPMAIAQSEPAPEYAYLSLYYGSFLTAEYCASKYGSFSDDEVRRIAGVVRKTSYDSGFPEDKRELALAAAQYAFSQLKNEITRSSCASDRTQIMHLMPEAFSRNPD